MTRVTLPSSSGEGYHVSEDQITETTGGYTGPAIERLAAFENLIESILSEQIIISGKLDILRNEGKKNSVQFRELLVKKMTHNHLLILLESHGIQCFNRE